MKKQILGNEDQLLFTANEYDFDKKCLPVEVIPVHLWFMEYLSSVHNCVHTSFLFQFETSSVAELVASTMNGADYMGDTLSVNVQAIEASPTPQPQAVGRRNQVIICGLDDSFDQVGVVSFSLPPLDTSLGMLAT